MCCVSTRVERASGPRIFAEHVADAPGHRITIRGILPNRDTWIAG